MTVRIVSFPAETNLPVKIKEITGKEVTCYNEELLHLIICRGRGGDIQKLSEQGIVAEIVN